MSSKVVPLGARNRLRFGSFVDLSRWDTVSPLTSNERKRIRDVASGMRVDRFDSNLSRFVQPIWALFDALGCKPSDRSAWHAGVRLMLAATSGENSPYWSWSDDQWNAVVSVIPNVHMGSYVVLLLSALLAPSGIGGLDDACVRSRRLVPLARRLFGDEYADFEAVVVEKILALGYRPGTGQTARRLWSHALAHVVLAVGSPQIRMADQVVVERICAATKPGMRRNAFSAVTRALYAMGRFASPTLSTSSTATRKKTVPTTGWDSYIDLWVERQTRLEPTAAPRTASMMRCIGRWFDANRALTKKHVATPLDLDVASVQAFDRAVNRAVIGTFGMHARVTNARRGDELAASSKVNLYKKLRILIEDLVDLDVLPESYLLLLRHLQPSLWVKRQIRDDPRLLPDAVFAKLLHAALRLSPGDFSNRYYPFELVKAVSFVWLLGGLRSDEINRLGLDCVVERRVVDDKTVALLRVPANKFREDFVKPVAVEVADAVKDWIAVRPVAPRLRDSKTRRTEEHLFVHRARMMSKTYLNDCLIPRLCKMAGLETWSDKFGRVTSHRMRATMATALMEGQNGMSLLEMAHWLGHRGTGRVTAYAAVKNLSASFSRAKANLMHLPVFLDQRAVRDGVGDGDRPYLVVDVGEDRGGCRSFDVWSSCKNNLDCRGPACHDNVAPDSPLMARLRSETDAVRLTREILLEPTTVVPRKKRPQTKKPRRAP